ncbi:DUF7305 domain-containing protein [Psychromonas ossibalaenae]|uniref:DUF7305 domain-containing protein n=1 Tax=Psychromonas ossibalaenae TaxID=444922 RepID=UPI000371409B|nr:hypothetical protein [Psychromonas ossibalaenae]
MKQQKGFVLVSVLVITSITILLAFSQINEIRLQERISGNQQKELNARLAAEKGLFDAFELIDAGNKAGLSNTLILGTLQTLTDANYTLPTIELDGTGIIFTLVSKGEVNGAVAYLKTQIQAREETGRSLFTHGVQGCEGVAIGSGGGSVDSYNSRAGDYGEVLTDGTTNILANGDVATVNDGADIELSGTGKVYGSLTSNGNISTGTSAATEISGNITAAGDIQLKDITSAGDIHAGGDFSFKALTATVSDTAITAGGDINASGGNDIGDDVLVTYGGENNSRYEFGDPTTGIVAPDTDLGECDTVGIVAVMGSITTEITTDSLPVAGSPMASGSAFIFTEDSASADGSAIAGISASTLDALGDASGVGSLDENTKVLIFDEAFDITSKTVEIDGNVTLLINGDITIKNTTFTFTHPDTSSLTIITDGQVDIDTGTVLFTNETVNSEGNPPLTVYSSYASSADDDYAMHISANADMYTKLYAPLGNLALSGGAEIMGAVIGKNVEVSNGTAIHFDEVLLDMGDVKETEAIPASYSSIYYHYE